MRKVELKQVGMENFGPYIEPMVLDFKNNTITLIVGPNGVGKSMTLDAIPYTFYGVTSRGAHGDDVVNNQIGKNCKTWVKLNVDNDSYLITRYHKHSKFGNTVIVTRNGEDIRKGHRESLPFIQNLICSQKAFMNTLFFGQKVKDFFTDLTDSQRKEIFKQILNLGKYENYYKMVDQKLRDTKASQDQIQTQFSVKEQLLQDCKRSIQNLEEQRKKFMEERERKLEEISKAIESEKFSLEVLEKTIEELKGKVTDLSETKEKIQKLDFEIQSYESKYQTDLNLIEQKRKSKILELQGSKADAERSIESEINEKNNQLEKEIRAKTDNLNRFILEIQKEISDCRLKKEKLSGQIDSRKARIREITEQVLEADISTCPVCEQEVNEDTKKMLLGKIKTYEKEISELEESISELENRMESLEKERWEKEKQIQDQIRVIRERIEENISQKNEIISKLSERLNTALQNLEIAVKKEKEALQKLLHKIEELREEKRELEDKVRKYENDERQLEMTIRNREELLKKISQLESNKKIIEEQKFDDSQITYYKNQEKELHEELKTLESEKKELAKLHDICSFWKVGFSFTGIPAMLIDESIPFINNRLAEYLDILSNGRFIVTLDTVSQTKSGEYRDKISENIIDTHTKASKRVQLSGGQTRLIDIAMILTLSDLQGMINDVFFNFLLFDEIFDSLDYENSAYVCKVLRKIRDRAIVIIAHQNLDQLEADVVLNFQ